MYTLNNATKIYVGETLNASARMNQHQASAEKADLTSLRVVVNETFNKSACLDLESFLIRLFAGEGRYQVLNRNEGVTERDYYDRDEYRKTFQEVFEDLRSEGLFQRTIPQIENSDLFKFSPFKALNHDQATAVEDILEGLFSDIESGSSGTIVVQGDPGTGKTIVAIYMMKLLRDIQNSEPAEDFDSDSLFSDFFLDGHRELLQGFRIGLVVPQQSLRDSIRKVFKKTPLLAPEMVLSPFDLGAIEGKYDLLIVDESHRLNQRANQPSGPQNKKFREINEKLFGSDRLSYTQLDWIREKSTHQVLLVDSAQSVRPADLPENVLKSLIDNSKLDARYYRLFSQMRVRGGADYVDYVRAVLSPAPPVPTRFGDYDLRFFDDIRIMADEISARESESQLARLVAGYAWEWKSRNDATAFDIEIDGSEFRWNQTQKDWINTAGSINEVGSIHTVQGYDLNYAGVIIGPDLRFDPVEQRIYIHRASYFDKKGKENNPKLGITYSDNDLLRYITNVYAVLMTRGILGTYVYVCDRPLREYLRGYLSETK
ncbi:DNA/RNA helicase domain-containing protein [Paeniglutamicibacter quisquiliarum]|uniref:DNA/RNA helicase domain-containing protein n=1 Tax=Paeniglutamicibacter quisquiliarum TaxID=2849498 RepID=UPI00300CC2D6